MPILIDRATVRSLFTMSEALVAAREAFLALAEGRATMPQRLAVRVEGERGTQLSMPCHVASADGGVLSIKVATVFEDNVARFGLPTTMAFLALQDARSGELLALMDAEHLTAMRTAAGSALATDLLAPATPSTLAVFGAGAQAEAHVDAMVAVRPIKAVSVVSLDPRRAEALAARVDARFGIPASVCGPEAALQNAAIVCTATNSSSPVFPGSALRAGTHINAIGSFRRDMQELDLVTVQQARVFVDRREAAQNGAGELIAADLQWEEVVELGELLTGRSSGRRSAEEVTLYKSVGISVQDACAAARVYGLVTAQGLGTPFDLG